MNEYHLPGIMLWFQQNLARVNFHNVVGKPRVTVSIGGYAPVERDDVAQCVSALVMAKLIKAIYEARSEGFRPEGIKLHPIEIALLVETETIFPAVPGLESQMLGFPLVEDSALDMGKGARMVYPAGSFRDA